MSKQRILDVIQTAQRRAVAIQSTVPGFAFSEALSMEGYLASIDAARDAVFQYIALESRLNAQRSAMLAARRVLAEWSRRMLCAIHSTCGKDSPEYRVVAAATSSAPRRRPRKRRGAAVAGGGRTVGSKPDRSTAGGPVEDAKPAAHEAVVGTGRVDVGREGDAGTEPRGDVANETEAARRIEVLAPRERRAGDAGPADAVEGGREIDGAETVAKEDVEGPKPKTLAINDADAGRAWADALAIPGSLDEDALHDGNHQEADMNQDRPHVAEDAGDEGKQDGEGGVDAPGVAKAPGRHGRGGTPWRGCGWEGVRRVETRRRAVVAVPWTIPEAILKE